MNLLPFLYLNRLDGQLAPDWSLHALIQREQWTVVVASRPLPGEVHWVGGTDGFPAGSYAAGPWSQYGEQWRSLDAQQVVLTNNRMIIRKLEEAYGKAIEQVLLTECDEYSTIRDLAAQLEPPLSWLDPPPVDSGELLNLLYAYHPDPLNLTAYSEHKSRTAYDYTPYAVTVRQRIETAVQTLVSQGYAVIDGEMVRLSESAQAPTHQPHPDPLLG